MKISIQNAYEPSSSKKCSELMQFAECTNMVKYVGSCIKFPVKPFSVASMLYVHHKIFLMEPCGLPHK